MSTDHLYIIEIPSKKDYPEIVAVWEASVRATHTFLKEEDIQFFKPLILSEYLAAVELHCIKIENEIAAFLGTSDDKIEMLFAHPKHHGKGAGRQLLLYAVRTLNKKLVDVNEQNTGAVSFYKHFGFEVVSRSEKDGLGKPYPILHMQFKE